MNRPYFETKVVKVKKLKEKHSSPTEITIDGKKYTLSEDKDENVYLHKEKGNWVNGECIDKIKFPCFCSFECGNGRELGQLNCGYNDEEDKDIYELHRIIKQYNNINRVSWRFKLKELIEDFSIHIKRGKIIIFDEEEEK